MFHTIKSKLTERFSALDIPLTTWLRTQVGKNELFQAYLDALPEADRQHHNCNCCRSFLNHYGNLVLLENGQYKTLWDFEMPEDSIYANATKILRELVVSRPIMGPFLTSENSLGTDWNIDMRKDKPPTRWEHFHLRPCLRMQTTGGKVATGIGSLVAKHQVFSRGLLELKLEAVDTVLELIGQNSLYRGAEFKTRLTRFREQKVHTAGMTPEQVVLYAWEHLAQASLIRNTAIGTLLIDLSEGRDTESAVSAYERMVAPANYRRPTAVVTGSMIQNAARKVEELGLTKSLMRRHATSDDIPINNAIFVHRPISSPGNVFQELAGEVTIDPARYRDAQEVPASDLQQVMQGIAKAEVLFERQHVPNLVSLTTSADPEAQGLFSWGNNVAWVYRDGNADSVKEKVKAAGGNVDAPVRISLAWHNYDDLDLHIKESAGAHIYYIFRSSQTTGARLDVDMNAGSGTTREPVENVFYPDVTRMPVGEYLIRVHNYSKRENMGIGFEVEVEILGVTHTFYSDKNPPDGNMFDVAVLTKYEDGSLKVVGTLPSKTGLAKPIQAGGLTTNRFWPVSMIVPSPNHWDGQEKGNLHTFFLIDEARAETPIRGFFNEFLKPELAEHRKVFELLGAKTQIQPDGRQSGGLGFSSTARNHVVMRLTGVDGKVSIVKIVF